MKTLLFVCAALLVCGALAKNKKSDDNKVKIAVYYESLCPDSKRFITDQLAPVWRDFRGAVKVKLVPYGKSTHDKVNGKWQFNCHHGPDECYGNKVQACILKDRSLQDTEKMELVICLMGQASPDKSLDTCLEKANKQAESTKLKRCASSEQGDNLLAGYGDKSDAVQRPLSFVPTIVVNEHDKVNGKWQFNCHHGPDECYGNRVQACILKDRSLQDTEKMELVICLMGQASPDKSLDTCLEKANKQAESTKLKRCASSEQGDNLLAGYGDKSDAVQRPLSFVPTIVVNERFDQATQDEAFTNLKAVICRLAPNKPAVC